MQAKLNHSDGICKIWELNKGHFVSGKGRVYKDWKQLFIGISYFRMFHKVAHLRLDDKKC